MANEESRRRLVSLVEDASDQEFLTTLGYAQVLTTWALTVVALICGPSVFEHASMPEPFPSDSDLLAQQIDSNSSPAPGSQPTAVPSAAQASQPSTANIRSSSGLFDDRRVQASLDLLRYFYLAADRNGRTLIPVILPLSVSATVGSCRMVRIALDMGAVLNFVNPTTGSTALHLAATNGHIDVARLLLERGANFTIYDTMQRMPLHAAAEAGHASIVELLLSWGSDINSPGIEQKTALHWAVEKGHRDVVRLLLAKGADMEICIQQPLHMARSQLGGRALYLAVVSDHIDIVRMLLDRGAQVDGLDYWDKTTPLTAAVLAGKELMVELLCERGANPNSNKAAGSPLLVHAVSNGYERITQILLDHGVDLQCRDVDGDPPLHSAAFHGHFSLVKLLLEKGADVHATGGGGRNALCWAIENDHNEIANFLRGKGATANFGRDIVSDTRVSFAKLANGKVYEHIEQAQNLMTHESEFSAWAERLRFVVEATEDNGGEFDLEMVESDSKRWDRYIAVSYCWSSNMDDTAVPRLRIRVPDKTAPGGARIRDSRASTTVLRRCMEFARSRGISNIWIDQECIRQDDEIEKQYAIQAMHLVYQQAACTLVILGPHIQTANDIKVLPNIEFCGPDKYLIDRILSDNWFRRAWTTQEWLNSNPQNLSYLVYWKGTLDMFGIGWRQATEIWVPKSCATNQKVFRVWELTHEQIFRIVHMTMQHHDILLSVSTGTIFGRHSVQDSFTLLDHTTGTQGIHKAMIVSVKDYQRYKPLRLDMCMAYLTLKHKRNLLVSDRLAILSNLAHYPYSVDTSSVAKRRLSFSCAILATALFNGDLSVLRFNPHRSANASSGADEKKDKLWAPRPDTSLEGRHGQSVGLWLGNQLRSGDPAFVIDGKLLVRGLIWDITPFSGLNKLKDEISKYVAEYQIRNCRDYNSAVKSCHEMLRLVSKTLLRLGERDLLELVIVSAMKQQLARPSHITNLMREIEAWYHGRRDWLNSVFEKTSEQGMSGIHVERGRGSRALMTLDIPDRPGYEKPEYDIIHPWGNAIIQWIYRTVAQGKPLAVGRCQTESGEKLVSFFTVDPQQHKKVFTPLCELEYEFGINELVHLAARWKIWCLSKTGESLPDSTIRKAQKKLARAGYDDMDVSETFRVEGISKTVYGVWSPRLFRLGLIKEAEGGGWSFTSLGKAASYIWLS